MNEKAHDEYTANMDDEELEAFERTGDDRIIVIQSSRRMKNEHPQAHRTTGKGVEKTAWVVDYVDGKGIRRLKTFAKKKDADAFEATAKVEVREGVHVADRDTVTVVRG